MSDEPDFDDLFSEDLDLSASVGDAEIALRKSMGNERFEKMVQVNDVSTINAINFDVANIRRMNAIARTWDALEKSIRVATGLAVAWSIYRWVFGRVTK